MGKITAADMLTIIEEASNNGKISSTMRQILIRDMSDILNKIGEGNGLDISSGDKTFLIRSSTYKRYYRESGMLFSEVWQEEKSGGTHRDDNDKSSYIQYHENGNVEGEYWNHHSNPYRENDKPTSVNYFSNGQESQLMWKNNRILHREGDKPALISFYKNGNLQHELWSKKDLTHREGGKPAIINYYENGDIYSQEWRVAGNLRRPDNKPTVEYYDHGGKLKN